MHEVSVNGGDAVLDATLLRAEYELFQFAMRRDQRDRGRCLEGNATLGSQNRIPEVNASANAVSACELFEFFDQLDGRECLAVECRRHALAEVERVTGSIARFGKSVCREYPGVLGNRTL